MSPRSLFFFFPCFFPLSPLSLLQIISTYFIIWESCRWHLQLVGCIHHLRLFKLCYFTKYCFILCFFFLVFYYVRVKKIIALYPLSQFTINDCSNVFIHFGNHNFFSPQLNPFIFKLMANCFWYVKKRQD